MCLRAIGDNCRLFCFDTFDLDYVYCCFGMYGITMPSVWCFLLKERLWISGVRIETCGFVFAVFGYLL